MSASLEQIQTFLRTGEEAEAMAQMALDIANENHAENLETMSESILDAMVKTTDTTPERLLTVFGSLLISEWHATLVNVQKGKHFIQSGFFFLRESWNSSFSDSQWKYDTEKEVWFIIGNPPDDSPYGKYGYEARRGHYELDTVKFARAKADYEALLQKLESDCLAKFQKTQKQLRDQYIDEQNKIVHECNQAKLNDTKIPYLIVRILRITKAVRSLPPQHQLKRTLLFQVAEIHLNHLFDLTQTFIRQLRIKPLSQKENAVLHDLLEKHIDNLLNESVCFYGVSGAHGRSVLSATVDLLRDLQIFLAGQTQEIRRSKLLEQVANSVMNIDHQLGQAVSVLHDIHHQLGQAVSVLHDIHHEARKSTRELGRIRHEMEQANDSLDRHEWLQYKQLQSLGALGMVVGSMRFSTSTHTHSFGLFGGASSTTHLSGGPGIQFPTALRHIEQFGLPRLGNQ